MKNFKLKKDWIIKSEFLDNGTKTIFEKGHVFKPNENGEYIITSPIGERKLSFDEMLDNDRFELIKEHQMNVSKVDSSTDEEVNNWRIQLDVKTTKSKLKEVQRLIEEHVYPIL